ncbi:MAG TPA: hypothetical protein VMA71_06590 [Alloacidobacterium sp.]|nr:hypothetical protein [Alloacidobacterium sp.]
MRSIVLTLCVFLVTGCSQEKSASKPLAQQPQTAAANAIGVLQKLVNEQNYKSLGFASLDEVKEARLGQPMEVYNIGVEKLKNYQSGQDPNSLLTTSEETIYPVTVDGIVRSGVTLVHKEQGFEPSSFGNAEIVKRLAGYRQTPDDFAVRIPALNLYFVGRYVETRIVVAPIVNDPRLKVRAGEAAPLEVVVDQLRPYADSYKGLPM